MSQYTVALEALTKDSQQWNGVSTVLAKAGKSAEAIVFTPGQLSWAADSALQATYDELRVHVATLLAQGADETGKISRTLAHVRQIYESSDQKAKKSIRGVWDIKK